MYNRRYRKHNGDHNFRNNNFLEFCGSSKNEANQEEIFIGKKRKNQPHELSYQNHSSSDIGGNLRTILVA